LADSGQVQQIVMNLVANAAEAIGGQQAGDIVVKTGIARPAELSADECPPPAAGEYVFIEVSDTGCGMDEATKAKMFDPFFTTKFTGRGLGLAAVSGIVRAHGGSISVVTAPGAGSTLKVCLRAGSLPRTRPESSTFPAFVGRARKLLVVDDEECVRAVAGEVLSRQGYEVIFAKDGQEALAVFEQRASEIDLVLLDLVLPRLNGVQVIEGIRRLNPRAKVLLTSGHPAQEVKRLCGTCGEQAFLQKPYTAERLVRAVASAIG
jgi:CheY-like chemotaxis protein